MRPRVFSFSKNSTRGTHKYCGGCKTVLLNSCFAKGNHRGTGLSVQCRNCYRAYHHMRMATDPAYVAGQRAKKNAWYKQNAARAKAWRPTAALWKKINPDKVCAHTHNRNARKRAAGGVFTDMDIADRYIWQCGMCAICQDELKGEYDVDHILPIILGGSNFPNNLQLLCAPCNGSKGGRHPIDFMQSRGFLL